MCPTRTTFSDRAPGWPHNGQPSDVLPAPQPSSGCTVAGLSRGPRLRQHERDGVAGARQRPCPVVAVPHGHLVCPGRQAVRAYEPDRFVRLTAVGRLEVVVGWAVPDVRLVVHAPGQPVVCALAAVDAIESGMAALPGCRWPVRAPYRRAGDIASNRTAQASASDSRCCIPSSSTYLSRDPSSSTPAASSTTLNVAVTPGILRHQSPDPPATTRRVILTLARSLAT